jgi:hypothetical protein
MLRLNFCLGLLLFLLGHNSFAMDNECSDILCGFPSLGEIKEAINNRTNTLKKDNLVFTIVLPPAVKFKDDVFIDHLEMLKIDELSLDTQYRMSKPNDELVFKLVDIYLLKGLFQCAFKTGAIRRYNLKIQSLVNKHNVREEPGFFFQSKQSLQPDDIVICKSKKVYSDLSIRNLFTFALEEISASVTQLKDIELHQREGINVVKTVSEGDVTRELEKISGAIIVLCKYPLPEIPQNLFQIAISKLQWAVVEISKNEFLLGIYLNGAESENSKEVRVKQYLEVFDKRFEQMRLLCARMMALINGVRNLLVVDKATKQSVNMEKFSPECRRVLAEYAYYFLEHGIKESRIFFVADLKIAEWVIKTKKDEQHEIVKAMKDFRRARFALDDK